MSEIVVFIYGAFSLSGVLADLVPIYGPWIVFGVVALESTGLPLPGETILVGAAVLAGASGHVDIVTVVTAAAAGAIFGDGIGYAIGRRLGLPFLRRIGGCVRLNEDRLLVGRYLFVKHGNAVVFFGRFVAVLRMFAALLAGASGIPVGRFLIFNIAGGVCWASLFGFGAYEVGSEISKLSLVLSAILFGLFIAAGYAFSKLIRRNERILLRRAEVAQPSNWIG